MQAHSNMLILEDKLMKPRVSYALVPFMAPYRIMKDKAE
jgi:hypothetical protein